tara:strand:+ start:5437 stop:6390 length:954 start_codon:yes stop_codon:yes gene_type:complete
MNNMKEELRDLDKNNRRHYLGLMRPELALYTHLNPDMDSVLAVWAIQTLRKGAGVEPAKVEFVPARYSDFSPERFGVDIGDGHSPHHLKEFDDMSAGAFFVSLLDDEDSNAMLAVADAVSHADLGRGTPVSCLARQCGNPDPDLVDSAHATSLWSVLGALVEYQRAIGASSKEASQEAMTIMGVLFDATLHDRRSIAGAKKAAEEADLSMHPKVAVLPHNAPQSTAQYLPPEIWYTVFSGDVAPGESTVGIARRMVSPQDVPIPGDYSDIKRSGGYIHPKGFLVGWTRKSPYAGKGVVNMKETLLSCLMEALHADRT